MNVSRALPIFSAVFVLVYAAGINANNTVLFYYPKIGVWHWGRLGRDPSIGVASQWYGWTGTAIVAALVAAAISLAVPQLGRIRLWSGWVWVVPFAMWLVAINVIAHLYWLPKPS